MNLTTFPVFVAVVDFLGFDLVWFGVIFMINIGVVTMTPPLGMSLFVMKAVVPEDTTFGDVVKAAFPFIMPNLMAMAIVTARPQIALWLPGTMHS